MGRFSSTTDDLAQKFLFDVNLQSLEHSSNVAALSNSMQVRPKPELATTDRGYMLL
jgi:hypothetical protein